MTEKQKAYYLKNKEKIIARARKFRKENNENFKLKQKEYYQQNKEKKRQYYLKNQEKIRKIIKAYYEKNKNNENFKLKQKEYYQQNKEKIDNRNKIYAISHREQINARRRKRREELKLILIS
ncbi:hypothetical protein [Spiroplasma endosymbiont of Colias croceus]|uniref:hypothetical protein n=1 Tax=Spiroplasma endosymbiont of Colias croceus TaxID=3066310 RepID=UPI0030D40EB6